MFSVSAGAPLPPGIFEITANLDNLNEDSEGFIVYLEFNESALDDRDMGQVGLARDAYLVRILDQGPEIAPLGKLNMYTYILHTKGPLAVTYYRHIKYKSNVHEFVFM